jgi:peptidoglycan/LPS O-acetylase OafA/YrhL
MNNWPSTVKFPLRLGSYIAVSIAVAAVSHRYFEQPFLSLKDRFRRRERQSIVCPNADELVQSTSSTAK